MPASHASPPLLLFILWPTEQLMKPLPDAKFSRTARPLRQTVIDVSKGFEI